MAINVETLNGIIKYCREDKDDLEMVISSLEIFENYHQAIYALEITRRLFSCGAIDSDKYRDETVERDRTRTVNHNAVIGRVNFLNRLAEEAGLPPFYDGIVSEERPYRRELADAILGFVNQVMIDRI